MRVNLDLGLLLTLALVVGLTALITAVAVTLITRTIRPRTVTALRMHRGRDGSIHIIPSVGHAEAEDCRCHPRVDGLPGAEFIEHRTFEVGR